MRGKRLEDKKHAVGRMNTGVRCGRPRHQPPLRSPLGLASPHHPGSTPEDREPGDQGVSPQNG